MPQSDTHLSDMPYVISSRLHDWITSAARTRTQTLRRHDDICCSYRVEIHERYLLRVIDTPFEVQGVNYSKFNKLFIEGPLGFYRFHDSGTLIYVPDDDECPFSEGWSEMVCVDSYEELSFFQDDDISRRLVGVTLLKGMRMLPEKQFQIVIEIDPRLGFKRIDGIALINTETNSEEYKHYHASISLAIVAGRDLLIYPENIMIYGIFNDRGNIGSGGAGFSSDQCIAFYKL
jgi:hypothetical protein